MASADSKAAALQPASQYERSAANAMRSRWSVTSEPSTRWRRSNSVARRRLGPASQPTLFLGIQHRATWTIRATALDRPRIAEGHDSARKVDGGQSDARL